MRKTLAAAAVLATALVAAAPSAFAIPAFARKYQLSCSTCHAPFPRLKPFGEEFAGRGFRMKDPSEEPPRATYDVGDPSLRLVRDLPVAVRLDGFAAWKQDAVAETDFEWPWSAKVLSGGPISPRVSYYVYAIFEQGESVKLEDAWLQINGLFRLPLDLQIGQFQVCDPAFKRELRLEREDYLILKSRVGDSTVDLTYDRGAYLVGHAPKGVDVYLAVVNGNGIGEATDGNFDDDKYKDVAVRVVAPVGPVRLGAFGYFGKQGASGGPANETTYFGPDLVIDFGDRVQLSAEYLERRDDDPFFTGLDAPKWKTRGGFLELNVFPAGQDGRFVWSLLYNKVRSDDPAARAETASVTFHYLLARNVRALVEAGRDLEADRTKVSAGIVTAF